MKERYQNAFSMSIKLKFSQPILYLNRNTSIYQSKLISTNALSQFYTFDNGKLCMYQYAIGSGIWENKWNIPLTSTELSSLTRILYFPKTLDNGSLLMLKTVQGIDFYQYQNNNLDLVAKSDNFDENEFHDLYSWDQSIGNFIKTGHFYYDKSLIGIVAKHHEFGIKFYVVMKDEFLTGEYPIWTLDTDLSILGNISQAEFFLADLKRTGQENIIVRNTEGLNIYEFNGNNGLVHLMQIPSGAKVDSSEVKLFFPDLTDQLYQDIVAVNSSGLFVYQYNNEQNNYMFIHYNPLFSQLNGWYREHIDSIQFEDINLDGRQDMLFTGPQGTDLLLFNNNTNEWNSLLDNSQLSIPDRYSKIIKLISGNSALTKYPIIFTQHKDQIRWANIIEAAGTINEAVEIQEVNKTLSSQILTSSIMPQFIQPEFQKEKYVHLLRDKLDCSSIIDAVDTNTGKPKFKLPLVDLSISNDIDMNFFYDGNSQASGILGFGWSLPQNFIMMNHQSSIFPEDEIYYIIIQSLPQPLTFDSINSTDKMYFFKLSNDQSDLQICYHKTEERWEIDSKGAKQIYGRTQNTNVDAINLELMWENWRGVGSSSTGQNQLVTAWHLAEVRYENNNNIIRHTYDIINISLPNGKSFTQEVYLTSISDSQGNELIFEYSCKDKSEYNLLPLIDKEGNINTQLVETRYLSGYKVTTPTYQQDIEFVYKVEDGKRFLTKIFQKYDITNQPVIQFAYKRMSRSHVLENVILPTGTNVEFDHQLLGTVNRITEEIGRRYDVKKNHRVDYGDNDILISYIDERGQVTLRMFNQQMTEELYSSESVSLAQSRFPLLGENLVKSHEIVRGDDFFGVILYYSTDKELCLFHKAENKWSTMPKCYKFRENTMIRLGRDFIVVANVNSFVEVISRNKVSQEWAKERLTSVNNALLIVVSKKMFLVYDDINLWVGYKNRNDIWQSKAIKKIPGVVNDIKRTLDEFDVDSKSHEQILNYFKNNALQMNGNLLLLNRWGVDHSKNNLYSLIEALRWPTGRPQLHSKIDLFVLDSNYEIAQHQQYKIIHEYLDQFSKEVELQNKNFVTLGYKENNTKFEIIVKDFRGPILDEINRMDATKKEKEKEKDNVHERVLALLGKPFLLNLGNFSAILSSQFALCKNRKFTFVGNNWNETTVLETEKVSVPLGNKFILHKENAQSSIKLYNLGDDRHKKGNSLLDFEVKHLNITQLRNMYPVYLAYQEQGSPVGVVDFSLDGGEIDKAYKLSVEEKLSTWSNFQTLVTKIQNFGVDESSTLVFRQQIGIRRLLPNPVVRKVTISFNSSNKRCKGYEYKSAKALGNTIFYEQVLVIPGDNKTIFGWVEESKSSSNYSKTEKKVFDSQERLIKILKLKEEQKETTDNDNLYLNTTLLDVTGKLEVAQFSPYEIENHEVGYFGFENYETNRMIQTRETTTISKRRWSFNETDVVKQKFSFTGQNYLSLSGGILEGTFQPNNQNQQYVVSSWIQPRNEMLYLGGVTPYLKVIVCTETGDEVLGILSEVKIQSNDWFYLEVIVDLIYSKQIYESLQFTNSTLTKPSDINLKASIIIGSAENNTINVDHVRFSPLNCDFQAKVYDPKTKQVTEVISSSGLVTRHIYNKYGEEVATINEYGQLKEITSYTKSSSIDRITRLKSAIQIQPENGFYEDFSPYSFQERWKINNSSAWQISSGQIRHLSNDFHNLQLSPYDINSVSYGMRLFFLLLSEGAIIKFNNDLQLMRKNSKTEIVFSTQRKSIPLDGEILLVVEHDRLFVWIDGGLYIDSSTSNFLFNLEICGEVKINDFLIFNEPNVRVTYFNALDEKLQEVVLEDTNLAIVTEYLYDELGRQSITTQPARIRRSRNQSILAYYPNFVTNSNPYATDSVWKIARLQGLARRIIGENSYSQTLYDSNPLDEKQAIGLPGREFSVSGPYAKYFVSRSENLFINNLFPRSKNYSYRVEHKPGGVEDVSVFDSKNNRVARYVHVPGNKDLLSTYEYNEKGKLVKSLPPLYHEKVRTFHKLNSQLQSLTDEEITLQNNLGTHIRYDERGNIISKTTPDSGTTELLYDDHGLLKFTVHYSNFNSKDIENVMYIDYDTFGRLRSTGKLTAIPLPHKDELLTLTLSRNNTKKYQSFHHSDFEREAMLRGKLKRTITFNGDEPLIEESILNVEEDTLSKSYIIPIKGNDSPLSITFNKRYVAGKLRELKYPIDVQGQPFKLTYQYDKLGRVARIGIPGKYDFFASFTYNPAGQVTSEHHMPQSLNSFTRQYNYSSPGFLTSLEDKFLTEKVIYTDGSYGGYGYGDGTVTRIEFKATWHDYCENSKLGLNEQSFISENIKLEESALCFRELKKSGYLNEFNRQAKVYYPALEPKLPIVCSYGISVRQIEKTLGEKGFPYKYGHSYDYGNHQELTKAKYFVETKVQTLPLQPDTFAREVAGINGTISHEIWQILKSSGYIIEDNTKVDLSSSHGKQGKSFIRHTLLSDLKSLNSSYGGYKLPLERLLIAYFCKTENILLIKSDLQNVFIQWNNDIRSEELEATAERIVEMLENKQYLLNPIAEEFKNLLEKYKSFIPDIVHVLYVHFAKQIGEAEFDIESYDIDANGNHKHYYNGFDRYQLSYHNNTNQISSVKFKSYASSKPEHEFTIKHDKQGNIIEALHNGIKRIDYDSSSKRATKMQLTDGRTLTFYYDASGERVLKRVANCLGETIKEIHYIRDEFGRSLVEKEITYISQDLPPSIVVTAYIYGPRGLLGFIRRDKFYSVISDHLGSIRLVVQNGEVVAAYDYMPYGNFMRQFGNDPGAHISYRYTGQELDTETGLYNYHARFYDPSIGRFYQTDPKEQYFSPYKYAGNSPVSMIDPDGEVAITTVLLLGALGAWLGGSAANNNFNPFGGWDYGSGRTWLGIVGGGVGGAFMPLGIGSSMAAFTSYGLTTGEAISAIIISGGLGSYLSTAAANNAWDLRQWEFSPQTLNAVFQGFSIGSGAFGSIRSTAMFYKDLSSGWGKAVFTVGSTATGGGIFTLNGFAVEWDYTNPGFLFGIVNAVTGAPDLPMFLRGSVKFLTKNGRKLLDDVLDVPSKYHQLGEGGLLLPRNRLKSISYRIGKLSAGIGIAGLSAYVMGSAINDKWSGWDLSSPATYNAMIDGILTGGQISSFGRAYYRRKGIPGKINDNDIAIKHLEDELVDPDMGLLTRRNEIERLNGELDEALAENWKFEEPALKYAQVALKMYHNEIAKGALVNGELKINIKDASDGVMDTYTKQYADFDSAKRNEANRIAVETLNIYKEKFQERLRIDNGVTIEHGRMRLGVKTQDVIDAYLAKPENLYIAQDINTKRDVEKIIKNVVTICKKQFVIPKTLPVSRLHYTRTGQDPIEPSKKVDALLNIEEIPNSKISVMYNEKIAVVTFSTSSSPGLILYVDRETNTNSYVPLSNNKRIDGNNVENNQLIKDALTEIDQMKTVFRETPNVVHTYKDRVERELNSFLIKYEVESAEIPDVTNTLIRKLQYEFTKNMKANKDPNIKNKIGFIKKGFLEKDANVFNFLSANANKAIAIKKKEVTNIRTSSENIQKEINDLSTKITNSAVKSVAQYEIDKKQIQNKRNELSQKNFEAEILDQQLKDLEGKLDNYQRLKDNKIVGRELTKNLWENAQLEDFDRFPTWLPSNCAEANALVAISSIPKTNKGYFKELRSNSFELQDFVIATYSVPSKANRLASDVPNLEAEERCHNCKITTKDVGKVITDTQWLFKINNLKEDLKSLKPDKLYDLLERKYQEQILKKELDIFTLKSESAQQKLFLLTPYYDTTNRLVRSNFTSKLTKGFTRDRRSALEKQILLERPLVEQWSDDNTIDTSRQATNSVAKSASFVNNFLCWIKDSVDKMLSPYGALLGESQIQSPLKESVPNCKPEITLLEMGDQYVSQVDKCGTILLLETLIRKITGQKPVSLPTQHMLLREAQGYALAITEEFEKIVKQAAKDSKISMHRIYIDLIKVQEDIVRKIMGGKFDEILEVLSTCVKEACPGRKAGNPGKISFTKYNKFIGTLNVKQDVSLNKLVQQMLHYETNKLKMDNIKEHQNVYLTRPVTTRVNHLLTVSNDRELLTDRN